MHGELGDISLPVSSKNLYKFVKDGSEAKADERLVWITV
jgi:hypothetical protein